jgi:HAD superfamily hydrolase (TIGR01549 family)
MRGFVFDFDGPLFDGRAAAAAALAATAEHYRERCKAPLLSFQYLPLLPPRALITLVFSESGLSAAEVQGVETYYRERLTEAEDRVAVRPEIKQLLRELKAGGDKVAILSSRRRESVMGRLRKVVLDELVDVVHGRDSLPNAKPRPEALGRIASDMGLPPRDLVFIGDSETDYECARDAKVTYYQILWSGEPYHKAATGAAAVFETPADLREALAGTLSSGGKIESSSLPQDLVDAIANHDLCLYAGAGVSVPSGLGDWHGHYRRVLQELGAGYLVDADLELPEMLQLLAAQPDLTKRVFDRFRQSFDRPELDPNPYHYSLLRAQAERIWTSNYDQLFEKASAAGGFGYHVVTNDRALLEHFRSRRLVVKMNGDFASATYAENLDWNLVFTQEQFDLVERQRPEIWRLFEDDYRNRCLLFVGVSFRDAALRRIVAVARQKIPRTRYHHYLLARRSPDPVQSRQEDLQAANLRRHSIHTLFFSEFQGIEWFIADAVIAQRCPIIGFSGSFRGLENASEAEIEASTARLEGGSTTPRQVAEFGTALGAALAERGYRVTSGCSPVVGIPPVSAAFGVAPQRARFYLRTRGGTKYAGTAPAIVVPPGPSTDPDVYRAMRTRFVSELSLLIAYGGKARTDGRPSGVILEIEMAMANQIPVLIVPQVGGAVATYRETYLESIDRAYPDPVLAREIRSLNQQMSEVPASELFSYARRDLPEAIQRLMRYLARCSLQVGRREAISTDW